MQAEAKAEQAEAKTEQISVERDSFKKLIIQIALSRGDSLEAIAAMLNNTVEEVRVVMNQQ